MEISPACLTEAKAQIVKAKQALDTAEAMAEIRNDRTKVKSECWEFSGFVRKAWPIVEPQTDIVWGWHMDAICDHLQAIVEGRMYPRLIINVPPGSSKSLLVSVLFNAWLWGPRGQTGKKFLSTSFEIGNVTRDTRKTRNLIMSEWYQELWPEVALTRRAERSFENSGTGVREGVAFGSITGKRGDVFAIDDPHSVKGAESEVERKNAIRDFIEGGLNRLNNQAESAIIVVMQRVHENDLTGALLALEVGFEHLMIPMEFEPERACRTQIGWRDPRIDDGELMDPVRMPKSEVDKLKRVSDYMWAGQYQQRPAPREGGMFKVDKIEIVTHAPAGGRACRGWDLAASKTATSPYTAGAKLLQAPDGYLYIMDMRRKRASPFEVEQLIDTMADIDGPDVRQSIPQDPGSAGVAQKQHMAKKLAGKNFRFSTEKGSKEQRAVPFSSQVEAGMVRMVKGDWNGPLIDEMRNFPNSTYKDQVDALSRAYADLLGHRVDEAGEPPETPTAEEMMEEDPGEDDDYWG